jgi:hypothetical protein
MKSSGTSIDSRSTGSWIFPSTMRVTTSGFHTVSSNPSRRIVSEDRQLTRLACTSQASGRLISFADRRCRQIHVSRFFSMHGRSAGACPSGDVLMPMVIDRLSSSTRRRR